MPGTAIYPSLRGKTVVVTGGAEGIGAATVELFALQGSHVILLDISESSAEKTIRRITHLSSKTDADPGPSVVFYKCDVGNLSELQNAASQNSTRLGQQCSNDRRDWAPRHAPPRTGRAVNLRHVFFFTQAFVPAMKQNGGGSIVNLGSITWRISAEYVPVCKAAIMGLTRTQSKEFGPANIQRHARRDCDGETSLRGSDTGIQSGGHAHAEPKARSTAG